MGQNLAKDMSRALGKSVSHCRGHQTASPEVQAASCQALLRPAQADTRSTSPYQASSQNLVKSAGEFPCSMSDIGKDPVEYK